MEGRWTCRVLPSQTFDPPPPNIDVKLILKTIEIINSGVLAQEWIVISDSRGKYFQTIALLIVFFPLYLHARDWKVYLDSDL